MCFYQHRSWRTETPEARRVAIMKILEDGRPRSVKEIGELAPGIGTYHARLALQALRIQGLVAVEDARLAGRSCKLWRLAEAGA